MQHKQKAPGAHARSRGARAAAVQGAAPGAGELRAAKHAGRVMAAAGHERPILRNRGGREEGRQVELRKHLAALPAEEALRGGARPSRQERKCRALSRGLNRLPQGGGRACRRARERALRCGL
jgi:hypothetical protein